VPSHVHLHQLRHIMPLGAPVQQTLYQAKTQAVSLGVLSLGRVAPGARLPSFLIMALVSVMT